MEVQWTWRAPLCTEHRLEAAQEPRKRTRPCCVAGPVMKAGYVRASWAAGVDAAMCSLRMSWTARAWAAAARAGGGEVGMRLSTSCRPQRRSPRTCAAQRVLAPYTSMSKLRQRRCPGVILVGGRSLGGGNDVVRVQLGDCGGGPHWAVLAAGGRRSSGGSGGAPAGWGRCRWRARRWSVRHHRGGAAEDV